MNTSEQTDDPIYDLKEFEKSLELNEKDELAYLNQYYTKKFFLDTNENNTEDLYIYQAPNKLCVIGLAPAHPLLQLSSFTDPQLPKIKTIQYDSNVLSSINKKRQNPLSINSEICVITTEDGRTYSIKAGVIGWVVDINMRFEEEIDLLQHKKMGNFLSREEQLEFAETLSLHNSSDGTKGFADATDTIENNHALKEELKISEDFFDLDAIKPPLMHPFIFIKDICTIFSIEQPVYGIIQDHSTKQFRCKAKFMNYVFLSQKLRINVDSAKADAAVLIFVKMNEVLSIDQRKALISKYVDQVEHQMTDSNQIIVEDVSNNGRADAVIQVAEKCKNVRELSDSIQQGESPPSSPLEIEPVTYLKDLGSTNRQEIMTPPASQTITQSVLCEQDMESPEFNDSDSSDNSDSIHSHDQFIDYGDGDLVQAPVKSKSCSSFIDGANTDRRQKDVENISSTLDNNNSTVPSLVRTKKSRNALLSLSSFHHSTHRTKTPYSKTSSFSDCKNYPYLLEKYLEPMGFTIISQYKEEKIGNGTIYARKIYVCNISFKGKRFSPSMKFCGTAERCQADAYFDACKNAYSAFMTNSWNV
ncbi:15607_t:CDS:2 [Acaulospora morrowiae]|uniref:15607_t:CDS:1 n=1 Tax=Acaulospora morrowiae TaxID=94023 RepID=A0A9N9FGZ2_9GLOM|nr:15607_t:CDS:2 [Acaulospora morrowiae]